MNIEIGAGIKALIGRMESNPEEFFDEAPKWRFMFAERFRDTMTESEKGAIHAALKEVRRREFEHKVMRTLLEDDLKNQLAQSTGTYTYTPAMTLDSNGGLNLGVGAARSSASLRIGSESLTETELRAMKEAAISSEHFR
jgi:hypothetical protein